ncbi:hypothetical protein KCU65_g5155, partial [Aureobasidium melanogenum]
MTERPFKRIKMEAPPMTGIIILGSRGHPVEHVRESDFITLMDLGEAEEMWQDVKTTGNKKLEEVCKIRLCSFDASVSAVRCIAQWAWTKNVHASLAATCPGDLDRSEFILDVFALVARIEYGDHSNMLDTLTDCFIQSIRERDLLTVRPLLDYFECNSYGFCR